MSLWRVPNFNDSSRRERISSVCVRKGVPCGGAWGAARQAGREVHSAVDTQRGNGGRIRHARQVNEPHEYRACVHSRSRTVEGGSRGQQRKAHACQSRQARDNIEQATSHTGERRLFWVEPRTKERAGKVANGERKELCDADLAGNPLGDQERRVEPRAGAHFKGFVQAGGTREWRRLVQNGGHAWRRNVSYQHPHPRTHTHKLTMHMRMLNTHASHVRPPAPLRAHLM